MEAVGAAWSQGLQIDAPGEARDEPVPADG